MYLISIGSLEATNNTSRSTERKDLKGQNKHIEKEDKV
jgi:hypothetical protein